MNGMQVEIDELKQGNVHLQGNVNLLIQELGQLKEKVDINHHDTNILKHEFDLLKGNITELLEIEEFDKKVRHFFGQCGALHHANFAKTTRVVNINHRIKFGDDFYCL